MRLAKQRSVNNDRMTDNLQLYHGSTNKFDDFKIQKVHKNGADMGYGIYLTDNLERATRYAEKYLYTVQMNASILDSSRKTVAMACWYLA